MCLFAFCLQANLSRHVQTLLLVCCRGRYLLPSHYSMVMIEQPAPPGCSGPPYLQMHLASAPVTLVMNSPNYTALLAFCEGNLTELSGLPNTKSKGDAAKKQNTTFNADFRFGPPVGVPPTFRMTLDVPEFMVRLPDLTILIPIDTVCESRSAATTYGRICSVSHAFCQGSWWLGTAHYIVLQIALHVSRND